MPAESNSCNRGDAKPDRPMFEELHVPSQTKYPDVVFEGGEGSDIFSVPLLRTSASFAYLDGGEPS